MSEQNATQLDDFDWVSARAKCTPFKVFERLRAQVKDDIGKRNSLTVDGLGSAFFELETDQGWFSVSRRIGDKFSGVSFVLTVNGIEIRDVSSHALIHDGILTISDEGRCMMRVKSDELNFWQFRKLALQDLFFVVKS